MADADEPTESLASLRWKQSAYVSRSASSAPLHPVPRASRVAVLLLCLPPSGDGCVETSIVSRCDRATISPKA